VLQDVRDPFCLQVSQWRNTTTSVSKRHYPGRDISERGEIELDLGHVPMSAGAGKKFDTTSFEKNVQRGVIECWVGCMAVQFPVAIEQIDFDGAAQGGAISDADDSVVKIGAGLAIPKTKLDDFDRFSSERSEFSAKFTSEPARLQLELIWNLG
jgi:hypothetical protein